MELKADFSKFKEIGHLLATFAGRDWPRINGASLNRIAFGVRAEWQQELRKRFILRNKFVQNSIQVQKVQGFNPLTQESKVGSFYRGLQLQEFGGIKKTKRGGPVAIPQIEARISKSIQRIVTQKKRISQLKLVKRKNKKRYKSKSAKLVAGMIVAEKRKLALKLRDNIYLVKSIRILKSGRVKARMDRIYHVGKKRVRIPKKPTLKPSINRLLPKMARIYISVAEKKLKRSFQFLK